MKFMKDNEDLNSFGIESGGVIIPFSFGLQTSMKLGEFEAAIKEALEEGAPFLPTEDNSNYSEVSGEEFAQLWVEHGGVL